MSGVNELPFFIHSFSAINKRTKSFDWFGSLAIAGSILLKQRNKDMSAAASVIGILLKSKSVEVRFVLLILSLFYFLYFLFTFISCHTYLKLFKLNYWTFII